MFAAAPAAASTTDLAIRADLTRDVSRIYANRVSSWQIVDPERIILWTSPSRPYLVQLHRRVPGLHFAHAIGVTSTGSSILERFDAVIVDGIRYHIEDIQRIDRAEAKALTQRTERERA